jgi:hypothetical protein
MTTTEPPEALIASFRTPYAWTFRAIGCTLAVGFVVVSIIVSLSAVALFWGAWLLAMLVIGLTIPYRIELRSHRLDFISLLRRRRLDLEDVLSVKLGWSQPSRSRWGASRRGTCIFKSRSGKRFMLEGGKGVHDFLSEVAVLRPDLAPELAPRWNRVEDSRGRSGYRHFGRPAVTEPSVPGLDGAAAGAEPAQPEAEPAQPERQGPPGPT